MAPTISSASSARRHRPATFLLRFWHSEINFKNTHKNRAIEASGPSYTQWKSRENQFDKNILFAPSFFVDTLFFYLFIRAAGRPIGWAAGRLAWAPQAAGRADFQFSICFNCEKSICAKNTKIVPQVVR